MNVVTGMSSNELFGGAVPDAVRGLIEAAKAAPPESVSAILWTAQALAPSCLPVYYLLYKFHATRAELADAARAARMALREAGLQSGLPRAPEDDLTELGSDVDFSAPGPARFWLFTLKALSFISVRQGSVNEARRLIEVMERCDPTHSVGSDVTAALVAAAELELASV